ncbi:MAG: ABC transporter substrate-binding protein [Deltaproteobacteria bacterium]|nr:ABC transporter substrate-binding protein [Deltaproteobacteria bacterium]
MKRLALSTALLVVLAIAAAIWWRFGATSVERPHTTGLSMRLPRYYWPGEYWIEIADKKGWFAEAGLPVELIDTNPDYAASLRDVMAGKLDSNSFALFDLIKLDLEGADLVFVIKVDDSAGVEAIVARPEIGRLADLCGHSIGVDRAGSSLRRAPNGVTRSDSRCRPNARSARCSLPTPSATPRS